MGLEDQEFNERIILKRNFKKYCERARTDLTQNREQLAGTFEH